MQKEKKKSLKIEFDKNIFILSAVVFILFLVLGSYLFQNQFTASKISVNETPLLKNTRIQIAPGEQYVYGYVLNDSQVNITYNIYQGNECTVIRFMQDVNLSAVCINQYGNDASGTNASYDNPAIIMFQPWMLAIHNGWQWNATIILSIGDAKKDLGLLQYRVIRNETYKGRTAYVVGEKLDNGETQYLWIDAQKRVLLKVESQGYEIDIIEGPGWLNQPT